MFIADHSINGLERPAVGQVALMGQHRTLAGGSRWWQMRRLTWERSGGNPTGQLDAGVNTRKRADSSHQAERWQKEMEERETCLLALTTGFDVSWERAQLTSTDYKDPLLSDLRLLKFSWAVSSCLETDTPAGGLGTLPFSKTGKRGVGGHK